jgi:hypothetical protein
MGSAAVRGCFSRRAADWLTRDGVKLKCDRYYGLDR